MLRIPRTSRDLSHNAEVHRRAVQPVVRRLAPHKVRSDLKFAIKDDVFA